MTPKDTGIQCRICGGRIVYTLEHARDLHIDMHSKSVTVINGRDVLSEVYCESCFALYSRRILVASSPKMEHRIGRHRNHHPAASGTSPCADQQTTR